MRLFDRLAQLVFAPGSSAGVGPVASEAQPAEVEASEGAALREPVCPEHGARLVAGHSPHEQILWCPSGEGCFVRAPYDRDVLEAPERFDGLELDVRPPELEKPRYRACPACAVPTSRENFGRVSGIIVDRCPRHGTWFDPGELGATLAFAREGGVERKSAFESREAAWQAEQKRTIDRWGRQARARRRPMASFDSDFDLD